MEEIWKPVKGYEGLYEVSSLGRVRSLAHDVDYVRNGTRIRYKTKPRMMKPQEMNHGYLGVQLHGRGGHKIRGFRTRSVHRLVAEAFLENPDNLPEVNHKDENKANNRLDNLEWISHKDNTNYGNAQKKRVRIGKDNPQSNPVAQYTLDGELVQIFESMGRARVAGFGAGNIHKCLTGKYSQAYGYVWKRVLS